MVNINVRQLQEKEIVKYSFFIFVTIDDISQKIISEATVTMSKEFLKST